jgi:CTP synthase (UTP-ammonia lyase)
VTTIRVGLIGDRNPDVTAHRAIPIALQLASELLDVQVDVDWIPTIEIEKVDFLSKYSALWCVPASPYESFAGALNAIRYARETGRPFLGTCGGFQHAVLEYARNVLRWTDAVHAEITNSSGRLVISALACSLVEVTEEIRLLPDSRISKAYRSEVANEEYRCSYAVNETFSEALFSGTLRISAIDASGAARAVELNDHPFFVATLFQPERAALRGVVPPLVAALVQAAARTAVSTRQML